MSGVVPVDCLVIACGAIALLVLGVVGGIFAVLDDKEKLPSECMAKAGKRVLIFLLYSAVCTFLAWWAIGRNPSFFGVLAVLSGIWAFIAVASAYCWVLKYLRKDDDVYKRVMQVAQPV